MRKLLPIPNQAMAHETYMHARGILANEFGNMFQLTDLWNSNIPTFEDYGQWVTKQMFMFNSDLLARHEDFVDANGVATHIYKLAPKLLAMLGVRYIISDGTVNSPSVTEVMHETSPAGTLRLYEIHNVNLGNFSPTKVVTANSYDDAVAQLQDLQGPDTVVLLGSLPLRSPVVSADQARLTVIKGGYHISA